MVGRRFNAGQMVTGGEASRSDAVSGQASLRDGAFGVGQSTGHKWPAYRHTVAPRPTPLHNRVSLAILAVAAVVIAWPTILGAHRGRLFSIMRYKTRAPEMK